MPLTLQHTQETLCLCHIYALAGMAGVDWAIRHVYDYGVDGEFRPVNAQRRITGFPLDFQAKATINWTRRNGRIVYDLEAKTYNDIVARSPEETTLILILLCLPREQHEWHGTTDNETTLRHACYWQMFSGDPTDNDSRKRVEIPCENLLTPTSLLALLEWEKNRRRGL